MNAYTLEEVRKKRTAYMEAELISYKEHNYFRIIAQ